MKLLTAVSSAAFLFVVGEWMTDVTILALAAAALIAGAVGLLHLQFARRPARLALAGSAAAIVLGLTALAIALAYDHR